MQAAMNYPSVRQSPRLQRAVADVTASALFTLLFFTAWPTNIVADDAGIILKYMDHFAEGYFYTYNPSDGPVFGISSFLHGIVAGFFAYTHLLSPLNSLFASNAIGVLLVSLVTFRILAFVTRSYLLSLVAWFVVMLSAPNFVINMKGGMETPLHLATLLVCLYCLLRGWSRCLFAASALAIVAKLDSAPMVLVLLLAYAYQHASASRAERRLLARQMLIYFLIPLACWFAFCQLLFGRMLPQSAYAKLYYQYHPIDSWFPFIQPWLSDRYGSVVLIGSIAATLLYLIGSTLRSRGRTRIVAALPGLMLLADLVLYYFYNPAEHHPWYYAIPEFLMRLQLVIVAFLACQYLLKRYAKLGLAICLVGFAAVSWHPVTQQVQATTQTLALIEGERMAIGSWVHEHSDPADTLFAGHGHIARESRLYTIDYSGLNSRIATDYQLDFDRMVADLRPRWIVMHGVLGERLQREQGYRLRQSFYTITTVGFPAWRIYQQTDEPNHPISVAVEPAMVHTDKQIDKNANGLLTITGTGVTLSDFGAGRPVLALTLGLVKPKQGTIVDAWLYNRDHALVGTAQLALSRAPSSPGSSRVEEWLLSGPASQLITTISIRAHLAKTGAPASMIIFDPIVTYPASSGALLWKAYCRSPMAHHLRCKPT